MAITCLRLTYKGGILPFCSSRIPSRVFPLSSVVDKQLTPTEKLERPFRQVVQLFKGHPISERHKLPDQFRVTPAEERSDLSARLGNILTRRDKTNAERILREYMHNQLPAIDSAAQRARYREWRWFFMQWPNVALYGSSEWSTESIVTLRDDHITSRILHREKRTVNSVNGRSAQTSTCKDADPSSQLAGPTNNNDSKGFSHTGSSFSASSSSSSLTVTDSACRMNCLTSTLSPDDIEYSTFNPLQPSSFLSLPAELRNNVYTFLMPEHTNIDTIMGLMQSCRQIWEELHSMFVKRADGVLQTTEQKSVALHKSFCGDAIKHLPPTYKVQPLIQIPTVQRYTQLRSVSISLPATYGYTPPPTRQPARRVRIDDAFADLRELLALHLTFVTIQIPIEFAARIPSWEKSVRANLLHTAHRSFKTMTQNGVINAEHVIFDYSHRWIGPLADPGHRPYIAFVRQETRASKVGGVAKKLDRARHVLLGHDPAMEGFVGDQILIGDEVLGGVATMTGALWYVTIRRADLETNRMRMERLEDIIRRSRKQGVGDGREIGN